MRCVYLGELAEANDDDAGAAKFMQAAALLSRHESAANIWMLRQSIETGDYQSTIDYADIALRTAPELAPFVVPVLVHIAESRGSTELLTNVLAANPPWRGQFFAQLPQSARNPNTPLVLLSALQSSAHPPTGDGDRPLRRLFGGAQILRSRLLHVAAVSACRGAGEHWLAVQWQL